MADARRAAVVAMIKQENAGYSNLILKSEQQKFSGTPLERAFFTAIFYGTIERYFTINYILQKFLSKHINKLDAPVRCILQTTLYQIKFMDKVPSFAAINEAVTLTKKMGKSSASGMVNAVLRKAASYDIENDTFENIVQEVSVKYSVSPQIAQLFINNYPQNYRQILQACFLPAKLCIRINTLSKHATNLLSTFESQGIKVSKGFDESCLYIDYKGDITQNELFKKGAFHVQGETSQIACATLNAKKGQKVIDVCAAPGGKSATIAQYLNNNGTLISCDIAKNRLSLIESVLNRLNITCAKVIENDATVYNEQLDNANAVLCDVPCSGLGIMAKKPDIRLKDLDDLNGLVSTQKKILDTSSKYLNSKGFLLYSTCTINPAENEDVVNSFLQNNNDFESCKISNLPDNAVIKDNFATFYPSEKNNDGFFIALLMKK